MFYEYHQQIENMNHLKNPEWFWRLKYICKAIRMAPMSKDMLKDCHYRGLWRQGELALGRMEEQVRKIGSKMGIYVRKELNV